MIGSAAVAGGVAFGAYVVKKPHENPLAETLKDGEASFNPFVKITGDRIMIIAPHADLGQGAQSAQATLVAEELDVDLDQVDVQFGAPSPAYHNTALAAEIVPFMSFDEGLAARTTRNALGAVTKVAGIMVTGGSSTIPDSYEKLRRAGAVARETLKQAASNRSGVAVGDLTTERGAVVLPDGTAMPYTELAADAALIEPIEDVELREPSAWRLIGKPMQRMDVLNKSTGTQDYGIDLDMDGMVHAAVRFNPRQGGALLRFDASAAETMRGVRQIVPVQGRVWSTDTDGKVSNAPGLIGVAVVADNTWRAFRAVEEVICDWGPAPYPAEMDQHWQVVSDSFSEDRFDREWRHNGDVDSTLARAEVIQAEYRTPYVAHAPLEPLNAVVKVDGARADVWAAHQMPRFVQQQVARVLEFEDAEQVRFHNLFAGGSFGHRLEFENITVCAEIARQVPGVPVKLTFTREEDFAHEFPRQIGMARMQGTVSDAGVECYDAQVATVSSTASQSSRLGLPFAGPDLQIAAGLWNMPFDVPNLRVRTYRVPELAPTSSWRSVGASSAGFFGESFMDELCHAAGVDPLQERLRLVNNEIHRKVLETVGEMSGWGGNLGPNRGRGLAMVESFGVPTAEVVEVTQTEDGLRIDKVYIAADVGRVVDPETFDNLMKGGVLWGLGHAMNCEITYEDGMAEQNNYDAHDGMRLYQCPEIEIRGLENGKKIKGIGEPPVPPAAPALANAIFDATGKRLRNMPFYNFIDFV
ncbi:MAG: molybdopterin cofactor-binding domain-containing protein [Pseudomonadota bacterium]